jgi:hypothetical protein
MRKHGWQLPYHPLQVLVSEILALFCYSSQDKGLILVLLSIKVVAVAVFLALAFAFYVFFAPFVGKKIFQYVVIGLYTPLVSISL